MNKNQRLLFWMLVTIGVLFILVPQLLIWSQTQSSHYAIFNVVNPEQGEEILRLKFSLLPWRYIGILGLGAALGLLVSTRIPGDA